MSAGTEAVEVAAFMDHADRCRRQAQRGLNAPEPWARGSDGQRNEHRPTAGAGNTLPVLLPFRFAES